MSDDQEPLAFPPDWDAIPERVPPSPDDPEDTPAPEARPPARRRVPSWRLLLVVAAWSDLVVAVAVCAAALLAVRGAGHPVAARALPWAAAFAGLAWTVLAACALTLRRGTPGMLVAGIAYAGPLAFVRVPMVVVVEAVAAALAGLPTAALGRSLLTAAGGAEIGVVRGD